MIATREQQKEKALELLRELGVHDLYIECVAEDTDFVKKYSAWHEANGKLKDLIESFERNTGAYVYYVTHEDCPWGECYSFLCVSKYSSDIPLTTVRKAKHGLMMVHAWVENLSRPECSEFGTIVVKLKNDGFLVRQA